VRSVTGFEGKVALITGAGSGFGEACSRMLVSRGAQVLLADVCVEAAKRIADELGDSARAYQPDVKDPAERESMVRACIEACGRLDIALNIAGIPQPSAVDTHEIDPSDWRRVMSVDLDGVFLNARGDSGDVGLWWKHRQYVFCSGAHRRSAIRRVCSSEARRGWAHTHGRD
jgi:NAD(P)-dependent dehydrogenase (short-subunit alcohol dehydrogenase family)